MTTVEQILFALYKKGKLDVETAWLFSGSLDVEAVDLVKAITHGRQRLSFAH